MNIGQAAKRSGVNAKMIRHYESIGLLAGVRRTDSGYRVYDETDLHTLGFIRRARDLGFSMKEIKKLLGLWRNKSRESAAVKALALRHVKELEEKAAKLREMADALRDLAKHCHGDARPDCPILEGFDRGPARKI
ncbi:MAG: Cu(I)-responsive transcriptional regulator [Bdellovibrionales bacterium]|nr:Cu(I)-responsive transcriptional regulator [Bdellovibrionales bacterium]